MIAPAPAVRYRHEAFFYSDVDGFLEQIVGFARDAVAAEEPILVLVDADKINRLRGELGDEAGAVQFADVQELGANPALIIPLWQQFVSVQAVTGGRLRGVGEPVWPGRGQAEMAECGRHEALLNIAFTDADFSLLCPYNATDLDDDVLDEARRNHPYIRAGDRSAPSDRYPGREALSAPHMAPLSDPPSPTAATPFNPPDLPSLRAVVTTRATSWGINPGRAGDLALAVHEVAANSIRHGGGHGTYRMWREHDRVVCEVRDEGLITNPLADRTRPRNDVEGGRGLWIANQLCDLVQLRRIDLGTVVRLHLHIPDHS